MYTTFHLTSAQDINADILDAIKATYKSRPITIIVEEDEEHVELSSNMKNVLEERMNEDEETYLSGKDSIKQLIEKYGL